MIGILDKELQTFNSQKSGLIGKARGKFALVKDDKIMVVGQFDYYKKRGKITEVK